MRSLDADRFSRARWILLLIALLLGGWGVWFFEAEVPVIVTSASARLEVVGEVHRVGAPMAGPLVEAHLRVDQKVRAGDLLVEVDTTSVRIQIEQTHKRIAAVRPQQAAIQAEILAIEQALEEAERAREAALSEASSEQRKTRTSARHMARESERLQQLRAQGLVSELEYQRSKAKATDLRLAVRGVGKARDRLGWDRRKEMTEYRIRLEALRRVLAELEARIVAARSEVAVLEYQIELGTVRAPIDGRLGEVALLKPGSVVTPGQILASVIPNDDLRVVAFFHAGLALGRLAPGQPAELRMAGFPWSQYGTVQATVAHVAGETSEGLVRVELDLRPLWNAALTVLRSRL